MNRIHSGWLTKSPPESRMRGFFKSQWRRRFFVLYAPPSSAGAAFRSHAFIDYYDSDRVTNRKGVIELKYCEELQDRLDSTYYKHLFSLRINDRGHARTYYLAADTEADMDMWVDQLSNILGFKSTGTLPAEENVLSHSVISPSYQTKPKPTVDLVTSKSHGNTASQDNGQPPLLSPKIKQFDTRPFCNPDKMVGHAYPLKNQAITTIKLKPETVDHSNGHPPPLTPKVRQSESRLEPMLVDYSSDDIYDHPCSRKGKGMTTDSVGHYNDQPPPLTPKVRQMEMSLARMDAGSNADESDQIYDHPHAHVIDNDDSEYKTVCSFNDDGNDSGEDYEYCTPKGSMKNSSSECLDDTYDFPPSLSVQPDDEFEGEAAMLPMAHSAARVHDYVNAPSSNRIDDICQVSVTHRTRSFRSK